MHATLLDADHLPPASLPHARALREALRHLLSAERFAAADFLLALADFDQRRGWEALGHASLFAFLTRELGLSKGGAFFRLSAARLVTRFPEVLDSLRDGRLCITSVVELARVATPENLAEVLPRFFGCSSREAREVAAAIAPRQAPPLRMIVTALPSVVADDRRPASSAVERMPKPSRSAPPTALPTAATEVACRATPPAAAEVQSTEPAAPPPARPRAEVEPLDAQLRRLHLTVDRRLLDKVSRARAGLSHAHPGATTEQVLEIALDLLLVKQARAKALVRRPRTAPPPASATRPIDLVAGPQASGRGPADACPGSTAPGGPSGARAIPAAVEREVRLRDGDRCQYPLDAGGACGSTWQVELDHLVPLALGGPTSVANLRCTCRVHNGYAAQLALGKAAASMRRRPKERPGAYRRGAPGR